MHQVKIIAPPVSTMENFSLSADPVRDILLRYRKVVVVGCSRNPEKDAHAVPAYLKENGYEVLCVNPNADSILDSPTFHSLREVPEDSMEIVVIFRPSREVGSIAEELIRENKIPRVFWMQEGIKSKEARELLEKRGVQVVEDRCIRKEHARVFEPRGKEYAEILKFARTYAKAKGLVLNPDPEKLDAIIMGLVENQRKHGYRYCPCRMLSGNPEEDRLKICPCRWHLQEIAEMGHCHCGLFWDPKAIKI